RCSLPGLLCRPFDLRGSARCRDKRPAASSRYRLPLLVLYCAGYLPRRGVLRGFEGAQPRIEVGAAIQQRRMIACHGLESLFGLRRCRAQLEPVESVRAERKLIRLSTDLGKNRIVHQLDGRVACEMP